MEKAPVPAGKPWVLAIWRLYFLGAILVGVYSVLQILGSRSEAGFLSFRATSTSILLVVAFLLLSVAFAWMLLQSWRHPERVTEWLDRLFARLQRVWCLALLLVGVIFLSGCYLILQMPDIAEPFTSGIFYKLLPLIVWITGISGLTLLALPLIFYGPDLFKHLPRSAVFYSSLILLAAFFLLWIWVAQNWLQVETKRTGWNSLGTPIIETQVLVAWLGGLFMLLLLTMLQTKSEKVSWLQWFKPQRIDLLVALLLWVATVIVWESVPLQPSYFVSKPRPPNHEFYPASDAFGYDTSAQNLLVGEGFVYRGFPYIRRPLHGLYLTALHLIGGQSYDKIVFFQVLFLALLPPLMYLLTRLMHNRVSGAIAAILIMFREANAISIASSINTSHAKALMADLPATIGVMAFVLIVIAWLQQPRRRELYSLMAGGLLAIPVLIRFETTVFIFPLAILSAWAINLRRNPMLWVKQMFLFVLGLGLVLTPWIYRNYRISGEIFVDSPTFRFEILFARYRSTTKPAQTPFPTRDETQALGTPETGLLTPTIPLVASPTSTAMAVSLAQVSTPTPFPTEPPFVPTPTPEPPAEFAQAATARALQFIKTNPAQVIGFVFAHYANSQLQTFIIFPTTFRPFDSLVSFIGHRSPVRLWQECCSALDYTRRLPYWRKWDGVFPQQALLPLVINLLLIASGITIAWKRDKLLGLTPLIFAITYMAGNAIFRNSGGRYILPVDWSNIPYFSIGLAYLTLHCFKSISGLRVEQDIEAPLPDEAPSRTGLLRSPKFYLIIVVLFLFGSALPAAEQLFQPRYSDVMKDQMLTSLKQSEKLTDLERTALDAFLDNGGKIYIGRALYPRFVTSKAGEPWVTHEKKNVFGARAYPRMSLFIAGPDSKKFVIPVEKAPSYFPNASDVLIFGCTDNTALAIAIFDRSGSLEEFLMRSPLPASFSCPMPSK